MNRAIILVVALVPIGCSRQDAEALSRIGTKLHERAEKLLTEEPNGKLVRSLPLLQPPKVAPKPDERPPDDNRRL